MLRNLIKIEVALLEIQPQEKAEDISRHITAENVGG
jgi:hypothetical protein